MPANETKIIGFFAYSSPREVVCTDNAACIIAGFQKSMEEYLKELDPHNRKIRTIRKTRFGEIMQGLLQGAAYAFDEDAYSRFYPLAREAGLEVQPADFAEQKSKGIRFFTVQLSLQ